MSDSGQPAADSGEPAAEVGEATEAAIASAARRALEGRVMVSSHRSDATEKHP